MFRVAILTKPYLVPYTSYAGQNNMNIQYNNYANATYIRYARTYSGRPLGQ